MEIIFLGFICCVIGVVVVNAYRRTRGYPPRRNHRDGTSAGIFLASGDAAHSSPYLDHGLHASHGKDHGDSHNSGDFSGSDSGGGDSGGGGDGGGGD